MIGLQGLDTGEADSDGADWQWFARGYITITVLDGNTDAGQSLRDVVTERLCNFDDCLVDLEGPIYPR